MAAVWHTLSAAPLEAIPTYCSPGTAPKELEAHSHVDSTLVGGPSEVDVDRIELHDPSDVQALTTFWEVEEGQPQVFDVQG